MPDPPRDTLLGRALRRIAKGTRLSSLDVPLLDDAADEIDQLTRDLAASESARQQAEQERNDALNQILAMNPEIERLAEAEADRDALANAILTNVAVEKRDGWQLREIVALAEAHCQDSDDYDQMTTHVEGLTAKVDALTKALDRSIALDAALLLVHRHVAHGQKEPLMAALEALIPAPHVQAAWRDSERAP